MNFNEVKFLENVQRIHLKLDEISIYEAIADTDVRVKLYDFVGYDTDPQFSVVNTRFSAALDEICANIVGRTMFKVLMTKMTLGNILKTKGKIKIKEQDERGKGSRYLHEEWTVKINSDFYELDGTGISDRQYYGIVEGREVEHKLKSMASSMFHEFCHALHHISKTNMKRKVYNILTSKELRKVWGQDEELRTICCVEDAKHCLLDPICDHCFDLAQSILKGEPFLPRCSHNIGYRTERAVEDTGNRRKLLQHFLKYKTLLEGYLEYTS
jgi:glutaredoxin-related protein